MRFPRRIWPLLPAFLLLAASWAHAAKPKPVLFPIHASARHHLGAMALDSCNAGETDQPGTIADFIYPPDDAYYTLLRVSDCAACSTADTALFRRVHVAVETRANCPMPLRISVVGAGGPENCPTPDLATVLYPPESFDLIPPSNGTNDYVFTLAQQVAIVRLAFLVINFSDTSATAGCNDSTRRARLPLSDADCVFCKSYNDFTGPNGLDGIPDDLCGPLGTAA